MLAVTADARVYAGLDDELILRHIDTLSALEERTPQEWHVLLASWERLDVLTAPRE